MPAAFNLLLERGADSSIFNNLASTRLVAECAKVYPAHSMAQFLIRSGAFVDLDTFHLCIRYLPTAAITAILDKWSDKLDLNAAGAAGGTALHAAASDAPMSTVQLLIERGALVNMPNSAGVLPIFLAAWKSHIEVVRAVFHYFVPLKASGT
jgi:ankyrin repeat protein